MDSHPINNYPNNIGFKYRRPTKSYPRVANQGDPILLVISQDLGRSISDIKKIFTRDIELLRMYLGSAFQSLGPSTLINLNP